VEKVELPQYNLDSFSVAYQLNDFNAPTLDEMFDGMDDRAEIALQYGETPSIYASYEGDMVKIRRKISTFIGKDIPKRYVDFIPKAMDHDGVIMARWNGRDFKVYRDKFIFDCNGDDLDNVALYADEAISTFGIDENRIIFAYQANTKASLRVEVDNWNAVVFEDLIINDKVLPRVMSVANGVLEDDNVEEALHKNRSLVVYITYPRARCVYRYANGILRVSIASLSIDNTAVTASVAVVWASLKKYRKKFAEVYEKYSIKAERKSKTVAKNGRRSAIDHLRERLPELFANNYTRECHHLPIMLDTEEEAEEYRKMGRLVIKYPLNGKYSKWYTSPTDDMFVGLKLNRLSNKDKFKYIVNCYASNHFNNANRETYAYYHGGNVEKKSAGSLITLRILSLGRRGPLPIAMRVEYGLEGYSRIGTGGPLVDCVATALEIDATKFHKLVHKGIKNGLLNVVRQEAWNKNDEEILEEISGELDGKYYRLLEEVFECNILIVEIGHRSKYSIFIPQCQGKYIWRPRKGKYIVVMKNEKKLYDDHLVSYELVVKHDHAIFGKKDPLVSAIVSFKLSRTIRGDVDEDEVQAQYITEHGKCNAVITKNGLVKCNSRPLYKPLIDVGMVRERSVVYNHLGNKLQTSTARHLYFPNNASFVDWYGF